MSKKTGRPVAVDIQKSVYTLASVDGESAELTMYGDIYESQPVDFWTGKPVEGQFILLSDFLADLEQIAGCKSLTIRMNSYGGDAGVSNTIHNRLRELARDGMKLTCVVDGVAMSGGSLIMCACDTVRVNPSSLVMVHKCWTSLWGGYNADELRELASKNDAWDKMQAEIYHRKTGLSETVLIHMMSDTTYMTGREAVEKGFADEVIEDAEPLNIAASADRRSLLVNGRPMHLAPGMAVPDNIPSVAPGAPAPVKTHTTPPAPAGANTGGNSMTLEELRRNIRARSPRRKRLPPPPPTIPGRSMPRSRQSASGCRTSTRCPACLTRRLCRMPNTVNIPARRQSFCWPRPKKRPSRAANSWLTWTLTPRRRAPVMYRPRPPPKVKVSREARHPKPVWLRPGRLSRACWARRRTDNHD